MLNQIGFWEVTSSESSSSEAEPCAEDIEVEQIITHTNGIKRAEVEQVIRIANAIRLLPTRTLMADDLFKEMVSSSSAGECHSNEDEEHEYNPIVEKLMQTEENPPQTETLTHSNSLHPNTNTTTDQTPGDEVLLIC